MREHCNIGRAVAENSFAFDQWLMLLLHILDKIYMKT